MIRRYDGDWLADYPATPDTRDSGRIMTKRCTRGQQFRETVICSVIRKLKRFCEMEMSRTHRNMRSLFFQLISVFSQSEKTLKLREHTYRVPIYFKLCIQYCMCRADLNAANVGGYRLKVPYFKHPPPSNTQFNDFIWNESLATHFI